jgi:diphosphomevalonate decarboxylase
MSRAVVAVAHPNIALSKYWGKREGLGNFPAVPSLSVTLEGMSTRTSVRFVDTLASDRFVLDGVETFGEPLARATALLDRVRAASGESRRVAIESRNDFPTASGLASSASGFAALALASTRAAGLDWDAARVSDLARRSSASAARSLFGGFVELEAGAVSPREEDVLSARAVAPADHLDLAVLVCVTSESSKVVGSTSGMRHTASASPYYAAWLEAAPRVHAEVRAAVLAKDFAKVGELAEASALAMHASAIAAGVVYWNAATLVVLDAVRGLRARGVLAYATIDAGPHVKVLVRTEDTALVDRAVAALPGVLRVLRAKPGRAARIVDDAESTFGHDRSAP